LNELGIIVRDELNNIPKHFKNTKINEYIIMPNHLHFIIEICVGVGLDQPYHPINQTCYTTNQPYYPPNHPYFTNNNQFVEKNKSHCKIATIPKIIGLYKSGVTRNYNKSNEHNSQIWQRNYHEHIIRNEIEYHKLCKYIKNNPINYLKEKRKIALRMLQSNFGIQTIITYTGLSKTEINELKSKL